MRIILVLTLAALAGCSANQSLRQGGFLPEQRAVLEPIEEKIFKVDTDEEAVELLKAYKDAMTRVGVSFQWQQMNEDRVRSVPASRASNRIMNESLEDYRRVLLGEMTWTQAMQSWVTKRRNNPLITPDPEFHALLLDLGRRLDLGVIGLKDMIGELNEFYAVRRTAAEKQLQDTIDRIVNSGSRSNDESWLDKLSRIPRTERLAPPPLNPQPSTGLSDSELIMRCVGRAVDFVTRRCM